MDDFFIGLNDTTDATLLQDNLFSQGTFPGPSTIPGSLQVSTGATTNTALTAYLNAQYAAGATGGFGGDNIFLRFNLDAFAISPASRLTLTSGGNTTGNGPRINFDIIPASSGPTAPIPEPSTIVLMGSGLLSLAGYNIRRRKQTT